MPIATINPATGETVKTFTAATDDEVDAAIARAHRRFADYRQTSFAQRARWANATADLLEAEADQAAAMMTLEMGKTLAAAKAEALKCAKGFRYYAENAEALLADEPADAAKVGASAAYGRYQPLGVILAVMPWNFPLWQAVRFAAPALMAGNVGLLKHASNVPQCALYLADVIARGGFPDGCFQTLLVSSGAVEAILRDPRVAAATLTGSEPAANRWALSPVTRSSRPCSSSAAATRSSLCRRPIWTPRSAPPSPAGCRTTANPASPPSGSSSTPTFTTISSTSSSRGWRRYGSATRPTRTPTWARWPPSRAATRLPSKSRMLPRRAR